MLLWLMAAALVGQVEAPRKPAKFDDRVRGSVVHIQNHTRDGQANGVIIDQSRSVIYILTVSHLLEKKDQLSVIFFTPGVGGLLQPRVERRVGLVERLDKNAQDLAVLGVEMQNAPKLPIMPLAAPEVVPGGKPFDAFSLSCIPNQAALARPETVLESLRIAKRDMAEFWKVKDKPESGRSGGPLVDAEGRLIGLCSGADKNAGYFTHVSEIRSFLERKGIIFRTDPEKKSDLDKK